jgi:hypothetical protein
MQRKIATLEVSMGDFGKQVLHVLVSVLKIFDVLFNGGDERLFAVPCRLGMHAVSFSSVGVMEEKNDRRVRNSAWLIISGELLIALPVLGFPCMQRSTYLSDSNCLCVSCF